jgi:uncharacterized protein YcbX
MTHVKCTRFLDVESAQIAPYGLVGDREFLLVNERNALVGPDQHAPFLSLKFDFAQSANLLSLEFPDGRSVSEELNYGAECEELDYLGMRTIAVRKVLGDWDKWLSVYSGQSVRLFRCMQAGAGIDVKPVTLVTTGSLRRLAEELGDEVDHRRFRANVVIDADEPHVEDGWEGAILTAGSAKLRIRSSVPRCVVTQLDPDTGRDDQKVVRTLGRYRQRVRMPDGLMPQYATPGFASYAEVICPGTVSVGDDVFLEPARID